MNNVEDFSLKIDIGVTLNSTRAKHLTLVQLLVSFLMTFLFYDTRNMLKNKNKIVLNS